MNHNPRQTLKTHLKPILGISLLGALLLVGGCVLTSVYPYYTAKDVVFEPKLVGRWVAAENPPATNKFWEFVRAGTNNAYTLTVHDGDERTELSAHLFRLGQWTFIDGVPTENHDDGIPPHYLLKVVQFEPTLKMAVLDYSWVRDRLNEKPGLLRHLTVDAKGGQGEKRLVLTADTAELQKFVLKHVADTNAFPENLDFSRQH